MKIAALLGGGAALGGVALVVVVSQALSSGTESAVAPLDGAAVLGSHLSGGAAAAVTLDPAWVSGAAEQTGIPEPAVRAYGAAALSVGKSCALGWTTLAGIGWVESQHGTIDDRELLQDGHSSERILGPALDGEKFAAIRATPQSTALHGNPTWDHALGPMQFIPSTWETWARDGDGDGVKDPHDLDDAAAAAAAYLCHDGHDLTTSKGWNAAIFSYNHDNAYVVAVHEAANRYGLAVD